jgi:hypothetical protein
MHVKHLERFSLGLSYPDVIARAREILARPPLCGNAQLVIDESGVGRPVGDIFDDLGLKPIRVTITAGNEVTAVAPRRWNVSKTVLISTVDARLHTGELKIASALSDAEAMRDELKDFRRKLSDAGRATYAARANAHDDLVLAVAIATWWASLPPPPRAAMRSY